MSFCPNCRCKVLVGALFCSECGTQLASSEGTATQSIFSTGVNHVQESGISFQETSPALQSTDTAVSLLVIDENQVIPLGGREDFTIGRSADGQTILPDIDLSPYQAYQKGVSRLHLSFKITGTTYSVTDLGSVNGTRLNGNKVASKQVYPVKHGDILTLGKLKIQVLTRGRI